MKGLKESTKNVIKNLKEETEYQKFFTDKSILTIGTEAGFDGSRSDVINAIYVQPN